MNATEVAANRHITNELIRLAGTSIALTRPTTPVSDGQGGMTSTGSDTTLPAVQRYFAPVAQGVVQKGIRDYADHSFSGQSGPLRAVLVGPYTDDIRQGDTFVVEGITYHVTYVYPYKGYEVRATVVGHIG